MVEVKIKELGYSVPEAPMPLAAYVPAVSTGRMVYTAGQLPVVDGKLMYSGKAGQDLSLENAQEAAKICALNCLSVIKSQIGDLENIVRIVKLTVFVNSSAGFSDQPKVANGASEFLVQVFGDAGKHARSAVGVNELPLNAAVEIEMIVETK
ncbi:MAG: RidA family protein [Melioribacteraceae bacterium]|nr:RidA family protein [Melioribacteraceae bacterium]